MCRYALDHVEDLCAPYATVIDVDRGQLPDKAIVDAWSGDQLAHALGHVQGHPSFNARDNSSISFKVAAKEGQRTDLLKANEEIVGRNVTENIYNRHEAALSGLTAAKDFFA